MTVVVRDATPADVAAICSFGESYIEDHYAPLIGPEAARAQVVDWWNRDRIEAAVGAGYVVVAEDGGELVGVGQRGRYGDHHVVYKLYVHPEHRGRGIGSMLLDAIISRLPSDATRLYIEHFAANARAGEFYEREGYRVARVEPSPSGDPRRDIVWRVKEIPRG
ncbi:MAG: GNAT family N-acetyltransferase [Actinomycetes bacterium]|nr:MAG: GNAT family N-acetyltransferase [Actinomycetota bacterium]